MLLMAALALTAWFLRRPTTSPAPKPASGTRGAAILAILATILVGATGSLAALADTLFPSTSVLAGLTSDFSAGSPILVRMRWVHPVAAVVAFVCVLLLIRAEEPSDRLRGISGFVLASLALQFALGAADVLLLAPTWMQVVHLLGADIYWVALVILAARSLWPPRHTPAPR
jgi:cytochrome c oxidase assembly protein subunit 15